MDKIHYTPKLVRILDNIFDSLMSLMQLNISTKDIVLVLITEGNKPRLIHRTGEFGEKYKTLHYTYSQPKIYTQTLERALTHIVFFDMEMNYRVIKNPDPEWVAQHGEENNIIPEATTAINNYLTDFYNGKI